MSAPSFAQFRRRAQDEGFDEVLERRWPARTVLDAHTHPFAVKALVVEGEMWLETERNTRHLRPGDRFELARDEPHAERYGEDGAIYWVARRN